MSLNRIFSCLALPLIALLSQSCEKNSEPSLQDAFKDKFLIGTALNASIIGDASHPANEVVRAEFNSVTAANSMKWGPMNPQPGVYELELADQFVEFAVAQDMHIVGHALFWHSQTPNWVFEDENGDPLTREALLARMRERAELMAERYGEAVDLWDVVNESIESDGSWRKSKFQQIIGDDFTEQAFRIANEVMPAHAKLIYNDYSMTDEGRRDTVVAMVRDFQAKGIRIDGVGMQAHWGMDYPSVELIETSIKAFAETGVAVHITELDVDLLGRNHLFGANVDIRKIEVNESNNPYPDGILPPEEEERFAARYAELFELLLKHSDSIERVTFWGVGDGDSWLNFFPVRGRVNFALLFDRAYQAKPAYYRVLETVESR